MIGSLIKLSCSYFGSSNISAGALDVDGGVSEQILNEREKSAATLIALASEMHFSNS